jgi:hypothetical protein
MASNFDRRRINGPEESFSPVFDDEEDTELDRWRFGEPRPGRSSGDIRPICTQSSCLDFIDIFIPFMDAVLQPGLISQANGSAYVETERTKIACAVFVLSFAVLCYWNLHISTTGKDMDLDNPKTRHIVKKVGSMLKSSLLPSLVDDEERPCA